MRGCGSVHVLPLSSDASRMESSVAIGVWRLPVMKILPPTASTFSSSIYTGHGSCSEHPKPAACVSAAVHSYATRIGVPLFSSGVCALRRLARVRSKAAWRVISNLEFDALRQRQFLGPVDGDRLPPHVRLPRIAAGFAAATGVLLAAERSTDFRAAGADVDVRETAIAAARAQECFGRDQIGGEHC